MNNIQIMRHSCAHLLATAVQKMYPTAKFGVGPAVDDGFYYDISLPQTINDVELKQIEKTMKKLTNQKLEMKREEMFIDEAIEFFKSKNQDFKVELLKDLKERGTTKVGEDLSGEVDLDNPDKVSLYHTGEFVDLCRGPHVDDISWVGAFKLTKVAGAYWRGNDQNAQMQRIYGFCFATQEELDAHLKMLEEAKKRDHRKLIKDLDLVAFSELVGPGLPLWTPRGTIVRNALDDFVWSLRRQYGYEKVTIPHITKKDLYETSGHWEKFKDDLFKIVTREGHVFAMKPMNCPHHTQIFASRQRSYRDLPQRYAETTMVYRDEQSGELAGLTRVRSITQDDAHVFCREAQVRAEAFKIWNVIEAFYEQFGFNLRLRLSAHNPENMKAYLGTLDEWEQNVDVLKTWMDERGIKDYEYGVGEAAFYGPKIDFIAKDAIGREWQVATIQVDRNMPKRFGLVCVNEESQDEPVVMIHAAIMGAIERFTAIFIEHTAGAFPMWVAPEQVRLVPVSDEFIGFAKDLEQKLLDVDVRVFVDSASEGVGKKIRKAALDKVPWTVVIGQKEVEGGDLVVNVFGEEEDLSITQAQFIDEVLKRAKLPKVKLVEVK
ncbi:MAG: Threonine-tRNA ligase [Candidatus Uhrbacteria bacterium GW2011_GWD2_41_121]|uniref:Threonine--tRNA ligase n=1 Tax=Candidatus Uhrbacteria bacterium GW2011_GWC1_41_20 TaxID=1618983 RepID=A0A0G0XRV2_9BACT|nr:MAG: Threonine-tRNA ligase [Candidatus Uhrbacteria bacterium GW2011_GWE1_39_46]KKR64236.1 MAG: Threonine-tRNA ligase [Candidatus Uhrbacteria bacterium GW2011_GWC2_40_450]KKR90369.1 MAG: Threonine-tRNA ligase [Candidatus Uhrbacteria bacterium GW2011_GWD2_41_121]KKR96272.1 MAG: Threonine-tRNA ligase [Candidatus Uhrbacteria bacterium GW2011_GWD1_41_16]KKR99645.1 MAG: Threonine-tRNA ligase [Candidatus Uhrbacteria bacterium GW2011_GWC1_41_20]KKS06230.1 MAG: Threonine-tRNA ligase [Candidatus Uhrb